MPRAYSKVEQGQETSQALIRIARTLFSEQGFGGVSAEALVEQAGLTRGALYHHFGGKKQLFEAVFVQCEHEIAERILSAAGTGRNPVEQLVAGSCAFLDACADPAIRRIVIEDAPSVLGWATWRRIDAQHGLALLRQAVAQLDTEGHDEEALAYLLSGAMNELAMWVAQAPAARLPVAKETLSLLIRRYQPAKDP